MDTNYLRWYFKVSVEVSWVFSLLSTIDAHVKCRHLAIQKEETEETQLISRSDYLREFSLDWDCIDTAKEWIVQDSLDNIYVKRVHWEQRIDLCSCL